MRLTTCAFIAGRRLVDAAASADLDRQIATCGSFNACAGLLDAGQNLPSTRASVRCSAAKFGERAKQELMKRAVGPEPIKHDWYRAPISFCATGAVGARHRVGDRIIRDNPESPIGWAFVKIGTPRAIGTPLKTRQNTAHPIRRT